MANNWCYEICHVCMYYELKIKKTNIIFSYLSKKNLKQKINVRLNMMQFVVLITIITHDYLKINLFIISILNKNRCRFEATAVFDTLEMPRKRFNN